MLHMEFLAPPQKKKVCDIVPSLNFFYFPSVRGDIIPPRLPCWDPAAVLWLLNPPWFFHVWGGDGGRGIWDSILGPSQPWSQRTWIHFAWLPQDILLSGTPCIAQTSEAELPITLKSSGILCRTQFIMPQLPKSLVSSGHFFQLQGLRDYCESLPWGINICIASETVQVRGWYRSCTQDGWELGAWPLLLVSRAELKWKRALVLKIKLIPQAFHFVSQGVN